MFKTLRKLRAGVRSEFMKPMFCRHSPRGKLRFANADIVGRVVDGGIRALTFCAVFGSLGNIEREQVANLSHTRSDTN